MKRMIRLPHPLSLGCLLGLAVMPVLTTTAYSSQAIPLTSKTGIQARYGQLPLNFEANQGQTDSQVKFLARGHGSGLFLTSTEAVLSLQTSPIKNLSDAPTGTVPEIVETVLRMQWIGGRPSPRLVGRKRAPSRVNYLIGKNPAHWHTGVPTYAQVAYEGVYPGVDLVYYGNQGQLEYDVVVAPKADPRSIRLAFRGADRMEVNAAGELVLHNGNREIQMHKPVIYQEVAGVRKSIAGGYTLNAAREVGFEVGAYDRSQPLVIDPVLTYATYFGGSGDDLGGGIAVDSTGHAYVTGYTNSVDFPTTAGAIQHPSNGDLNVFVAKLNPAGTAFDYATYFGGSGDDLSDGIAVDNSGHAYVTGTTYSTNFPATAGAIQSALNGNAFNSDRDAFVAKLNPDGTSLDYATYLGGNGREGGSGIAVDNIGNAYVSGTTSSTNFPTTAGAFQPDLGGSINAFVAKLNPAGTALDYATYLGGNDNYYGAGGDYGAGIVVDSEGHAYVTGTTYSTNFPTTAEAFQPNLSGIGDAFVVKLDPSGTSLDYATYLGEGGGIGVAVDSTGHAYVTGTTTSTKFPTTAEAFQPDLVGFSNAFVAKLNPSGTSLDYATYLGGNGGESGNGIAVDNTGHAYVSGTTSSTNFPTPAEAFQPDLGGFSNAFVAKLDPSGTSLDYATYLGGSDFDTGVGIAVDGNSHIYVIGNTHSTNFPTTAEAFQLALSGSADTFVAQLDIPSQPENKVQCKNGGWQTFNNPPFKNQWQCVIFVKHLNVN